MQSTDIQTNPAPESSRADVRDQLTAKIIELLERGGLEAMKRWRKTAANLGRPMNAMTAKPYQGGNVIFLWMASMDAGYASPLWLTFKQAKEMGGQVRKGEKGTLCAYWSKIETKASKETRAQAIAQGEDAPKAAERLMCKPFWLFNVAQVDGLPAHYYTEAETVKGQAIEPIEAADRLVEATGAVIRYGGNKAFFSPAGDYIGMPKPEQFPGAEVFYATLQHELTHWTGHSSRLNREFGKRFGDSAYAFEELVAELGAAFMGAEMGFVDVNIEGHAHYVEHWLEVLKNDRNAIFTAAKHASEAADYLLACVARSDRRDAA